MIQILKIEKTGNIKLDTISDISELYKICGFRKIDGFEYIHSWERSVENIIINIELWGRISGKTTLKNSYIFPEPFNKTVYGNCVLIGKINMELVDIDEKIWGSLGKTVSLLTNTQPPPAVGVAIKKNPTQQANSVIVPVTHVVDLNNFSALSVTQNNKDIKNYKDNDTISSLSDNDDSPDSELKEEAYLYSSEEECG